MFIVKGKRNHLKANKLTVSFEPSFKKYQVSSPDTLWQVVPTPRTLEADCSLSMGFCLNLWK